MFPVSLFLLGRLQKLLQGSWSQKWAQTQCLWVCSTVVFVWPYKRQGGSWVHVKASGWDTGKEWKQKSVGEVWLLWCSELLADPDVLVVGGCVVGAQAWLILEEACGVRELAPKEEHGAVILCHGLSDVQTLAVWNTEIQFQGSVGGLDLSNLTWVCCLPVVTKRDVCKFLEDSWCLYLETSDISIAQVMKIMGLISSAWSPRQASNPECSCFNQCVYVLRLNIQWVT